MTTFELVARTAGCTALFILAAAMLRARHAAGPTRVFGAALCLGVIAYLVLSGSPSGSSLWRAPALVLAAAVPFFFWAWTVSVMDDELSPSPLAVIGAVALIGTALARLLIGGDDARATMIVLHSLLGLAFVSAALAVVLRGWRQDLVEPRRRLRIIIVALSGGYSVSILIVELLLRTQPPHGVLLLVNATLLGVLLLGLACGALQISSTMSAAFGWIEPSPPPRVEPAEFPARDREQELIARLNQLMTNGAAYRDAQTSIPSLAARLGVTEKKLRSTINGRLGFRNFPSFVNAFRVEEVRRRLSDPAQDDVPILTMALEAGFGSIVAFNRVFKDRHGVTPTAYRSKRSG